MKILLALDPSTETMDEAIRLATEKRASLTALFVLDATWNDFTGHDWLSGSGSRADFLEYARDDELISEADIIKVFRNRCSPDCEIKSSTGQVTDEILRELAKENYELLIMSHPFRRGLEIVRNTAGAILKHANCSVYLVRENNSHSTLTTVDDMPFHTVTN
jgi:nucleotide-binding universal stress UspA family protein